MRYLFISCHCDDAELSCGGTMAKLAEQHEVYNIAFSDTGSTKILDEFVQAGNILGISGDCLFYNVFIEQHIGDDLYKIRDKFDFVFTHSTECRHTHHKMIAEQSKRVINGNLITYLQPWNSNESPNYFIELSEAQLEKKIQALACYKSQAHRPYMDEEFIRSWARYNGIKCGKKYAEGFRIERLIQ